MAQPRPPKEVKPNFANDSRAKARIGLIVGAVAVVFLVALFFQSRKAKDNPALAMQKAAVEGAPGADTPQQALHVDDKKGIDQQTIAQNASASYDQTIQSAANEAEKQKQLEADATRQKYEQVAKDGQDRAARESRGQVPSTVRQDGTAGPSNAQADPNAPPQVVDPRMVVPPEAPYDRRLWMKDGEYRRRPAYETNEVLPVSASAHEKAEDLYFSGVTAPATVGLEPGTLTEMKRLAEDFGGNVGSVGVKKKVRLPNGAVNAVAPKRSPGGGNWGDWITVTPLPKGAEVKPGNTGGAK